MEIKENTIIKLMTIGMRTINHDNNGAPASQIRLRIQVQKRIYRMSTANTNVVLGTSHDNIPTQRVELLPIFCNATMTRAKMEITK